MWIPDEEDWPLLACFLTAVTALPLAVVMVPVALGTLAGFVYLRHLRETTERRRVAPGGTS